MGKVKKSGAVATSKGKKRTAVKTRRSGATNVAPQHTSNRRSNRKSRRGKLTGAVAAPVAGSTFHVRELDPVQKCGAATSVRRMFRIDETNGGVVRPHLVFFDRHGLYCEHGRDCPAVLYARSEIALDEL